MEDSIKKLVNQVKLTGVIAELEVRQGTQKANPQKGSVAMPYISVKGEIQFGAQKSMSRRFETYVTKYKKNGSENGLFQPTLNFISTAKSVAKSSMEEATFISIQGEIKTNDYVNKDKILKEGLTIKATFFNTVETYDISKSKSENLATLGESKIDVEGYIQSYIPEIKGEESTETGRLKLNILTTDFFGNIIPIKNIIVPKEFFEDFQKIYGETQTALFFLSYLANKAESKVATVGGLGVQRTTDGKTYTEMVLSGANPAVDSDSEVGISVEAIQIALKVRKEMLDELVVKGYQGKATASAPMGIGTKGGVVAPNNDLDDDDDLPF